MVRVWTARALDIVFWTLIIFATLYFVASRAAPLAAGYQTATITGFSMNPTIPYGSIVYVEPGQQPDHAGQIITFALGQGQRPITHRVTDIHPDLGGWGVEYQTAGDRDGTADPWTVTPSMVIGTYRGHIPILGVGTLLFGQPAVMAFLVLLLIALHWGASQLRRPREPADPRQAA